MTEHSALAIASAFLDAWTAHDLRTAGTYLADEFVFDGPIAHYRSAADFLSGSAGFVSKIQPGWLKIPGFGDDREALLLYDLVFVSGETMRLADHYTVSNGKIQTEFIVWDTYGSPFRATAPQQTPVS